MSEKILKATHSGVLIFGEVEIDCYVLEDKSRIISQSTFLRAIGRAHTPKGGQGARYADRVTFIAAKNLESFVDETLLKAAKPIKFVPSNSGIAYGYSATLLPLVCKLYIKAENAGTLMHTQAHIAFRCRELLCALGVVGITALVDEATGFQEFREGQELQDSLSRYLTSQCAAWAKRFPDEFYQQMFRLNGWEWKGPKTPKSSLVGIYTNEVVYKRLSPGILEELNTLNPLGETGHRKSKHHQYLSQDIGHPALEKLLREVILIMRCCITWKEFIRLLNRAIPIFGQQNELEIEPSLI